MPIVCVNRPNRQERRPFTARDAGRIVAYAKHDGATDEDLILHLAEGLGIKPVLCAILRVLDVLNTGFFIVAILGALRAVLTILKGLKFFAGAGGRSIVITGILEYVIPRRFWIRMGGFLIYLGLAELVVNAAIAFATAIANNVSLYNLIKYGCERNTPGYSPSREPVNFGTLVPDLNALADALRKIEE